MPVAPSPVHPPQRAALADWEGEGGATGVGIVGGPTESDDCAVLAALGAAVVARWNDLPTDMRRTLFETAAKSASSGRLARHLRAHRHDAA